MNLEEYINLYYNGKPTWFQDECNKYIHQDRIMNILNIQEYLDGSHAILNRADTVYNGRTFKTTKICLQYAKPLLAFQKSFLLKNPITLTCEDTNTLNQINDVYKQGRFNNTDSKILDKMNKYGMVSEYLFIDDNDIIKSKLIRPEDSYPVFTDTGDYVCFIEHYTIQASSISYYNVFYTDRVEQWDNQGGNGLYLKNTYKNLSGLPVLYIKRENEEDITQGRSDLEDYVNIIDKMEDLLSKYHDSFYKFLNPIPVVTGTKLNIDKDGNGAIDKKVVGNVMQLDNDSSFDLVLSKMDINSLKELYKILMNSLLDISMTPSIAMNGSSNPANLAEESIRMMYTLPVLKGSMSAEYLKQGYYSRWEQIEKLLQYKGINVNGLVDCTFNMSIPSNETELVNNIVNLYNNKLMSIDSAIEHSPYVNDIETEIKAIQTGQEVSKEDNQGTTVNKGTTTEKGTTSEDKENNI
ncbi:phage portal protein [Clostridium sp. MT-14]|uniref:phage portal protein n=1 Tax=Clostridium sp. MT-14 TaxID=3348360 RepID=UPI0035F2CC3C